MKIKRGRQFKCNYTGFYDTIYFKCTWEAFSDKPLAKGGLEKTVRTFDQLYSLEQESSETHELKGCWPSPDLRIIYSIYGQKIWENLCAIVRMTV